MSSSEELKTPRANPQRTELLMRRDTDPDNDPEIINDSNPLPVLVIRDVQNQRIIGSVKQVTLSTSVLTMIAPPNTARRALLLTNITGTQISYLGFDTGLTSSNGQYLPAAAGSNITFYSKGAVYGISLVAAQTLSVLEESVEELM